MSDFAHYVHRFHRSALDCRRHADEASEQALRLEWLVLADEYERLGSEVERLKRLD